MRTLASIAKAATDAFSDPRDGSLLPGAEAEPYDRSAATEFAQSIGCLEQTNRSLLADIEVKAHHHRARLQATTLRLDGAVVANAYSFERRLLGLPTGIRDGVILLSAAWEPQLMPWLCHRLQDFAAFDLATFRVAGLGLAQFVPTQLTLRNRVMTAIMRARNAQEVMALDDRFEEFLERLDPDTRRDVGSGLLQAEEHANEFHFISGAAAANESAWRKSAAGKIRFRHPFDPIASVERFVAARSHPFEASLTHRNGRLISLAGGFVEGDVALLAYQLTDRADRDANAGLMLRFLLVQQLIGQGVRYLAFIGNRAGWLLNYCEPVPAADLLMVRNARSARFKQRAYVLAQPASPIAQLSLELAKTLETRTLR